MRCLVPLFTFVILLGLVAAQPHPCDSTEITRNHNPCLYSATVLSVYDGDTATLQIDLGLKISRVEKIRFYGINAPERYREGGKESRDFLRSKIPVGSSVILQTINDRTGKYGRLLGVLHVPDGDKTINVNRLMIEAGHAKEYL